MKRLRARVLCLCYLANEELSMSFKLRSSSALVSYTHKILRSGTFFTCFMVCLSCGGGVDEPAASKYRKLLEEGYYGGPSDARRPDNSSQGGNDLGFNDSTNGGGQEGSDSGSDGNNNDKNNKNTWGGDPVVISDPGDSGEDLSAAGAQLFGSRGCSGCHGSGASPGPSRVRNVSASGILSARSATSRHRGINSWPNQDEAEKLAAYFKTL